jgi:hypothetical protein
MATTTLGDVEVMRVGMRCRVCNEEWRMRLRSKGGLLHFDDRTGEGRLE